MKPRIAVQEVVEFEQKINWTEKVTEAYRYDMELFEDQIVVNGETFPLREVFDISYRRETDQIGFLYLHTSSGIRTFKIEKDPTTFIQQFHHYVEPTHFRNDVKYK